MDKNDKYIKRLCKCILRGTFDWEKYQGCGTYYGQRIVTTRMVCSYGVCGYMIDFPDNHSLPEIKYDYDLKDLSVDDMDYQAWLDRAEHYDEYNDEWLADDDTELNFGDWLKQVKQVAWKD